MNYKFVEKSSKGNMIKETLHPATELEKVTCSRCGGSGHYSYCSMYGNVCFKCRGRKVIYTKRGAAAAQFLAKLRSKKAGNLIVGDVIWVDGVFGKSGWLKIESIKRDEFGGRISPQGGQYSDLDTVVIETPKMTLHSDRDSMIRVRQLFNQETLQRAIAYQATLTKAGTPRRGNRRN